VAKEVEAQLKELSQSSQSSVLDTRVEMWHQAAKILRSKALRLRLALLSLAVAVIAFAAVFVFDY
jgi:hypothetical protein